jgi:hypothetical protein
MRNMAGSQIGGLAISHSELQANRLLRLCMLVAFVDPDKPNGRIALSFMGHPLSTFAPRGARESKRG